MKSMNQLEKGKHPYVNLPTYGGFLVVHDDGAAPLASRNRSGAEGLGDPGERAIGCRGHIGHITQTQAPPCCPYTKPTCRNCEVRRDPEAREENTEGTHVHTPVNR